MEGVDPGWRVPPEFRGNVVPQAYLRHEMEKHLTERKTGAQ